jgi:hypothetical protein
MSCESLLVQYILFHTCAAIDLRHIAKCMTFNIDKYSYDYNTGAYVRNQLRQLQLFDFGQHEVLWCTVGNTDLNYQPRSILLSFI